MCEAFCDVKMKFEIPNTAFVPPPKVNASVVSLVPLKVPKITAKFEVFSKVVKALFQFRNKIWPKGVQ
jgi:16S rRNA A1518/A1519 N6-dimethyltransferase RsmA/KsgA/DIM1 with predicted DNA glycosylase/AP lyase activity